MPGREHLPTVRNLVIAARARAERIVRLCDAMLALGEHDLSYRVAKSSEHRTLDSADCDLERCAVWIGRVAEKAKAL